MSERRNLVLVLGDQLAPDLSALDDFDPDSDTIWMAENENEATHVWSQQQRLVIVIQHRHRPVIPRPGIVGGCDNEQQLLFGDAVRFEAGG